MNNIKKTFLILLFTLTTLFPLFVIGGNVFYSSALIYINNNGVKSVGTNETANAKAKALTYRNGVIGESSFTNAHPPIYGGPAYTSDEVGSSVFVTNL
ncbi:MAG: hypothetical protein PHE29_03900, partial [Tissierellia bacterium]|nr:hypothetical protein [Tissierellia bacterium]